MSLQSVLVSLALLVTMGCTGSHAEAARIFRGGGMQISISSGWVDGAAAAKAMPADSAKSEYVVGVQSRSALDGFNPNFNVFMNDSTQVDWAAGNGLSAPNATELAAYNRRQISKLRGYEVTPLSGSLIAGEPASEFAFTRTVDRCSCLVRQTSITVAHGGMFYTGVLTAADMSTETVAPILAKLRASWRWQGEAVSASPVPTAVAWYAAPDVLLTLADLPDGFQSVDDFPSLDLPGGASKVFKAQPPLRGVITMAVVSPDETAARAYRLRRAGSNARPGNSRAHALCR